MTLEHAPRWPKVQHMLLAYLHVVSLEALSQV